MRESSAELGPKVKVHICVSHDSFVSANFSVSFVMISSQGSHHSIFLSAAIGLLFFASTMIVPDVLNASLLPGLVLSWYMFQLESLPGMISGVWSEDPNTQVEATYQFRKLLSIGKEAHLLQASGSSHYFGHNYF